MDSPEGIRDNQGGDQEEISCGTEQVAGSVQDQDQKTSLFIFASISKIQRRGAQRSQLLPPCS